MSPLEDELKRVFLLGWCTGMLVAGLAVLLTGLIVWHT